MTIITKKTRGSKLEQLFSYYWESSRYTNGLTLYQDIRFLKKRRFRFDFLHPETRVVIEVQGGTYARGRHSRGAALETEYEKLNLALLSGYKVFLVTEKMIKNDWHLLIGAYIKHLLAGARGDFLGFLEWEIKNSGLTIDSLPDFSPFDVESLTHS